MNKCKKCGRVLKSEKSIERGYGLKCYRVMQLNQQITGPNTQITGPNNELLEELLNRVRKLELDNNFMKHQLKHETLANSSKDSELNWDNPKEVKEIKNQYKIEFNVVVKELKVIFHKSFDFHEILHPIDVREEPEELPLIVEHLELIH